MKKSIVFYGIMMVVFGSLLWGTLEYGRHLETGKVTETPAIEDDAPSSFMAYVFTSLGRNVHHPLAVLVLQVLCIMLVARVFGFLMIKAGQPSVVGEIIAGIVLGPSLMGALFPEFSSFLFPAESLAKLQVLSQIGLVLFMFIVGMELDLSVLKKKAHAAVVVSHASIIFPYFLGVALAFFLYKEFAPPNVRFSAFALFMGIAMSITAFPVLARIVQEKNMSRTPLGAMVITCAAADDITAWCLLAVVIAIVHAGSVVNAMGTILLSVLYVIFMVYAVKPFLNRFSQKYDTPESISKMAVAIIFGILLLSSFLTEIIGIHALFGAFMAGVIIPPKKEFRHILAEKIEDISLVLLLPLFFVFTGLRTEVGLLNDAQLWGVCGLIIGVAVVGKFVGSAVAAKFVGQSLRDSLIIGALMNTRGLMELVVINIGYDLGVISPEIFTMLVLMALITTFMAGPALSLIDYFFPAKSQEEPFQRKGFNPFISFGRPRAGGRLLELAYHLNLKNESDAGMTAAHFSPSAEVSIIEAEQYEKEGFEPIRTAAGALGVALRTVFKVTDNVEREIVRIVKDGQFDVVLVGSSQRLFDGDRTGGKIKSIMEQIDCGVGVFIDNGFYKIDRILMICGQPKDLFLLKYGRRFLRGNGHNVLELLDEKKLISPEQLQVFSDDKVEWRVVRIEKIPDQQTFYQQYDLIVVSLSFWKSHRAEEWLKKAPSMLIINK